MGGGGGKEGDEFAEEVLVRQWLDEWCKGVNGAGWGFDVYQLL